MLMETFAWRLELPCWLGPAFVEIQQCKPDHFLIPNYCRGLSAGFKHGERLERP
jgi:hypothetical protein